jgi:hypothetical protein
MISMKKEKDANHAESTSDAMAMELIDTLKKADFLCKTKRRCQKER